MRDSASRQLPLVLVTTLLVHLQPAAAQFHGNQSDPFFLRLSAPGVQDLDGVYLRTCHAGAALSGLCLDAAVTPSPLQAERVFYFNFSGINTLPLATSPGNPTGKASAGPAEPLVDRPVGGVYARHDRLWGRSHGASRRSDLSEPGPAPPTGPAKIQIGLLTHPLRVGLPAPDPDTGARSTTLWRPLDFSYGPTSTVATPLFGPGQSSQTPLGFDSAERLFVYGEYDDAANVAPSSVNVTTQQSPASPPARNPRAWYGGWAVCWARIGSGYYYRSLGWVTSGAASAQPATPGKPLQGSTNPTCVAVGVVREAVPALAESRTRRDVEEVDVDVDDMKGKARRKRLVDGELADAAR